MSQRGYSLVELIVVIGIIVALVGLAVPPFIRWSARQKVENEAVQLYTDLKWAQSEAMRQGEVGIEERDVALPAGGNEIQVDMRRRRIYVAFNTQTNSYRIYRWQDNDEDGVPENGEFMPHFGADVNQDQPLKSATFNIVRYGTDSSVTSSACSGGGNAPQGGITPNTNAFNCPGTANQVFNAGERCLRFDSKGFPEGPNNPVIYLTDGKYTYAILIRPTGTMTLCKWTGSGWIRRR